MKKRKIHSDSLLCDLAFAYCIGKNFLFRMFFGWQSSANGCCVFILPKHIWRELENMVKEHYKREVK